MGDANESELAPANISFLLPGKNLSAGESVGSIARWPGADNYLATSNDTQSLTLYYFRGPKRHEYVNAVNEDIDLPDGLIM